MQQITQTFNKSIAKFNVLDNTVFYLKTEYISKSSSLNRNFIIVAIRKIPLYFKSKAV